MLAEMDVVARRPDAGWWVEPLSLSSTHFWLIDRSSLPPVKLLYILLRRVVSTSNFSHLSILNRFMSTLIAI